MAQGHIVDVNDSYLECMKCDKPEVFIVDNTRDGKEKILTHLWEKHQYKGHITGVS